jgi:opacity protein-like surface antigen
LEADGGYLWSRESRDTGIFDPGGGFLPEHIQTSYKSHYLTTVGFRVGYAFGNFLPYVTGGLAIGDSDFRQEIITVPPTFREGGSKTNTDVGGMVGAGLQYALTGHWSLRGQYEFVDLGTFGFDHDTTQPPFFGRSEAKVHEHNLSFAVIFQF